MANKSFQELVGLKATFQNVEKDLATIMTKMFKNENLKKLVFHMVPEALDMRNLTEEETMGLIHKQFKIVPEILVDAEHMAYVIVSFDQFETNVNNQKFRDNIIYFDIVCNTSYWPLKDFMLRPYKIAGEIDGMFNDQYLTGFGRINFLGCDQLILSNKYQGLTLSYRTVHGNDDKVG